MSSKEWKDFVATRRLTPEQANAAKDAMDKLCKMYPVLANNQHNREEVTEYLISRKLLPNWRTVESAYLDLAPTGRLILNPAALGPELEQRYGDELHGPYAMSRVSADDLRLMTTPFRSRSERDNVTGMSADEYWNAHPELAAERHKHSRAAALSESIRNADKHVEQFLATHVGLNYEPTVENRAILIEYLTAHKLDMTTENLIEAFNACKSKLTLSEKIQTHGGTTVIDFGPRVENPSRISDELRKDVRRRIAKMSPDEFNEWVIRHPEEAALLG